MKRVCLASVVLLLVAEMSGGASAARAATAPEIARLEAQAHRIQITRDDWGIAHVHGATDADAVFGMIYAQCEDDFPRVERNYLTALGRLAEADGRGSLFADLRQRMFVDPAKLKRLYTRSPADLRALMDAWADGLNFFLARHPEVHPKVLKHFEPWMALSFTEGSIGGDIERVNLTALEALYAGGSTPSLPRPVQARAELSPARFSEAEPGGSNGFAIAPALTRDGHALLLINPHTSFFFRSELQMTSDAGLNAYGAVTWGQIFIYQGFNERAGWMHTSSGVDAVDEYRETVVEKDGRLTYRHAGTDRPVTRRAITLAYKSAAGLAQRSFVALFTEHGPVVRVDRGQWITLSLMNRPIEALEQSFGRTRSRSYGEFAKTMELQANSSNNTVFADADGDIAYWHGNFIPRRDPHLNWTQPVDGTDPATDWKGLLSAAEVPHLLNPKSGWLFNVNDSPWNGAGTSSLRQADYPAYVEQGTESARGIHAMHVLTGRADWTLDALVAAAYDSELPWFEPTLPRLISAWEALPAGSPLRNELDGPIATLRAWNRHWGADSVATTLAVFWGEEALSRLAPSAEPSAMRSEELVAATLPGPALLDALGRAVHRLTDDFGSWQTPWGSVNRFQRLTGDIAQPFSDAGPSLPVPFTSSVWGSLASFGAHPWPGTKKRYGTSGNSFVAVVEFGRRVRARAVTAGGESGHAGTKHFDDEAKRYVSGDLREVYFYPDQLRGHTERTYRPGAEARPVDDSTADVSTPAKSTR